jgi:hypothetical protein
MRRMVIISAVLAALAASASTLGAEEKSPAYTFRFSGYLKADIAYDQSRVNSGDYALYVLDQAENNVMSITARESRFGLDLSWKDGDIRTDGRFEFDFYGLGATANSPFSQENKPAPMLRHAYLQVTKGHWSLLGGQTSDIISPLVPKTVNYTVCWDQGNIGYRRPQFRLSAWTGALENLKISGAIGAFRTLGGDLDGDQVDDGAEAAVPTAQGRVAIAVSFGEKRSLEAGFSGHYGKEEYRPAKSTDTGKVESWSRDLDLKLTLGDCFELAGELFMGKDLGSYFGGVGQTVNALKNGVRAKGGWAQASYRPIERVWLNVGYAIDDPDDEDFVLLPGTLGTKSFIDSNSNIFGSVMVGMTSTVTAMFEISGLTTTYLYKAYLDGDLRTDKKDFDDVRLQFALKAAIK